MADYQCPTCFETMEKPKYAPVALKCGHVMCSTCLPRTIKRGQTNHVCGFCREECSPQDVYRIYLPPTVHSLASTSDSSNARSRSSSLSLSDAQIKQARTIVDAAARAGVESPTSELENIVTSTERWYMNAEQRSEHSRDILDMLLSAVTGLRRKLVYAARLDSAKQRHLELSMKADTYKNEAESYSQRVREAEVEVSQARREVSQWQQLAKRAEAKASQWKQQASVLEERRYTESVRAEGAVSILRSQIGVLQKEVLEQTQRKLKYKKRYYAAKKRVPRVHTCRCAPSDDDSLEIMSPTTTADEAEVSTAFSVPLPSNDPADALSNRHSLENIPEVDLDTDDDGSQTVIYGPPSQPLSRASSQTKKRKLSNASTSTDSSTATAPPPLAPEEQTAREAALDSRFSKRLRVVRDEGVKEGWVPPDWKARVVMADRIKEMKGKRKRALEEAEATGGETKASSSSAGKTVVSGGSRSSARKLQTRKA